MTRNLWARLDPLQLLEYSFCGKGFAEYVLVKLKLPVLGFAYHKSQTETVESRGATDLELGRSKAQAKLCEKNWTVRAYQGQLIQRGN